VGGRPTHPEQIEKSGPAAPVGRRGGFSCGWRGSVVCPTHDLRCPRGTGFYGASTRSFWGPHEGSGVVRGVGSQVSTTFKRAWRSVVLIVNYCGEGTATQLRGHDHPGGTLLRSFAAFKLCWRSADGTGLDSSWRQDGGQGAGFAWGICLRVSLSFATYAIGAAGGLFLPPVGKHGSRWAERRATSSGSGRLGGAALPDGRWWRVWEFAAGLTARPTPAAIFGGGAAVRGLAH